MLLHSPDGDLGREMPTFALADAMGETQRMADHLGEGGLVVAFICNHCPYVQAIGDRLAQDARTLAAEGTSMLAVMSNDWRTYPDDAPEMMPHFAAHFGFDFPYLVDADQAVGKAWGAVCTPEFFGLDAQGRLRYRGRLDD